MACTRVYDDMKCIFFKGTVYIIVDAYEYISEWHGMIDMLVSKGQAQYAAVWYA